MWAVVRNEDTREVVVTSPEGFVIRLLNDKAVLHLMSILSGREIEIKDLNDQRLRISENGELIVIQADPWINHGWKYGNVVCQSSELASGLREYCESRWLK